MVSNNTANNQGIQPGQYNIDYFSGAQVSLYIGDVWVDEVTSISYQVSQSRVPLYGYGDQLFRRVAEGQVSVQGQFSINFKEAGYLWLILKRYQKQMKGRTIQMKRNKEGESADRRNIEQITNNEVTTIDLNKAYTQLASAYQKADSETKSIISQAQQTAVTPSTFRTEDTLTGYSSNPRLGKNTAESIFETFENIVWGKTVENSLMNDHRRADDIRLNPFDIYLTYGDYIGDDTVNHTIRRMSNVHIIGTTQQIVIDGQPIQEVYNFLAQNII